MLAPDPDRSADRRAWLAAGLCALLLCGLIALVHRESPRTLVSAHGLLHAAIAQRYQTGVGSGFPPDNPVFAGEPLAYYWVFQFLGGELARLLGTDPLHALEMLVLASAVVLAFAAVALGRRIFGSTAAGLASLWLLVAGAFPQGPLVLAYRWLASWGPPQDDGQYLWGVVHPITRYMRIFDDWSMFGPLIAFFLNLTARPLGIASVVVLVLALRRALAASGRWSGPALALASFASACLSSVVGLATAGALVFGLVAVPLCRRPRADRALRSALAAAAWLMVGVAAAWPTFHHLLGRTPLAFHAGRDLLEQLGRMGESAWLLGLLAVLGAARASGPERDLCRVLLAAAAALAAGAAVVSLPVSNEDNLFHAALVILAVPAGGSVLARARGASVPTVSPARVLVVCGAFLPAFAVVVRAYTGRPPIAIAFDGERILRTPADSPEARLYDWIEAHAEPDAVLAVDPDPPIRTVGGNTVELPAMTRRAILTERPQHYLVEPYPDAALRQEIARALVDGRALGPGEAAHLARLGRPVHVVTYRAGDAALVARLAARYGEAEFESGTIAVFRWRSE